MKSFFSNVLTISVLAGVGLSVGVAIAFTHKVEAEVVYQPVTKEDVVAPVLERIAKCESGGNHFKDGQVVFNANKNSTVDVGKYQINSVWFKKATELGLDVTKEDDNYAMAHWIFVNRGTSDWQASAGCWQK